MASEDMSFENVDDDGRWMLSSHMIFRLIRCAKLFSVLYRVANLHSSFQLYSDITVPVNLAIKVIGVQHTQLVSAVIRLILSLVPAPAR